MSEILKTQLADLRQALLTLHKALVDAERHGYEETVGAIQSHAHFLQLLTTDSWFAWLQPLSQLIVSLDELDEGDEPLTAGVVDGVIKEARILLAPSENGEGFAGHYFAALQADTQVVIAHADVMRLLGRTPP